MSSPNAKTHLTGLARTLVQTKQLAEDVAREAYENARQNKIPFVTYLVQNDILDADVVAMSASKGFAIPLFNIDSMDIDFIPKELINDKLIRKHNALPLIKRGHRLFVALSDPTNVQALDEFKFHADANAEVVLVNEKSLSKVIDKVLNDKASESMDEALGDASLDDLDFESDDVDDDGGAIDVDDAPVVKFVNKILLDAVNSGASDIHFEPYESSYRIRFRQDGILREMAKPPVSLSQRLSARLKIMSRLDISERRIPQDGRFKLKISKHRAIDFRVSTCPTLFGEKVVCRILDSSAANLNVDILGMEEVQKEKFLTSIHQPQGMVLVTGPTGSGKTVTLYTAMNILNTEDINISTAEDPVEINLPGINQVNMNPKAGLTFASALRSFLRQDPDVVMVGEIRDLETAEIAVKAAQTGHMVLSTLHTNSAPETLTRLLNMGVATFNIATSVSLIIAQRLARRLCEHCKQPENIPPAALIQQGYSEDVAQELQLFGPVGCDNCQGGYKGRVGVYEVMPVSDKMGEIIMDNGNSIDIAKQAQVEGVNNLRQSGLLKAQAGLTSLAEINRITKD